MYYGYYYRYLFDNILFNGHKSFQVGSGSSQIRKLASLTRIRNSGLWILGSSTKEIFTIAQHSTYFFVTIKQS
jgi:hypothetical protein